MLAFLFFTVATNDRGTDSHGLSQGDRESAPSWHARSVSFRGSETRYDFATELTTTWKLEPKIASATIVAIVRFITKVAPRERTLHAQPGCNLRNLPATFEQLGPVVQPLK